MRRQAGWIISFGWDGLNRVALHIYDGRERSLGLLIRRRLLTGGDLDHFLPRDRLAVTSWLELIAVICVLPNEVGTPIVFSAVCNEVQLQLSCPPHGKRAPASLRLGVKLTG
ncbi:MULTISPECIES: hypothetical protein [Bradyrhizobium]|uniref:hypothetical protein n=1 Tax=Bradyrhizobium TaxID=374 RepID=UPI0013747C67|nr:hypothetical protein [Bradyrhizobium canariense]MBM7488362.1 hypothetical protein [Bradyrhizobium canariense]UFW71091.1 hypothetical protein BcanWU425_31000 [Bradyrhizobium canariense]